MVKNSRVAVAGGLAVLALLSGLALAFPWTTVVGIAIQSFRPQQIGWDAKNAWTKCDSAIADTMEWPSDPRLACAAMQMCANEAALSAGQRASLTAAARRLPGCEAP